MNLASSNYKILIVESSSMIVERMNILLAEMNCIDSIATAFSYGEALEKLNQEKFDVVLLDTQLPGKNGFELLSFIKMNYPAVKTIILTNQTSDFYRNKGHVIGSDHFIDKSNEFEKVVDIIKDYAVGYQMN